PWRRFLRLLAPHTPVLLEAFVCGLLLTLLGVSSSYFMQHLVDRVLPHDERRLLNALGGGMVLILLFRCLFHMLPPYLLGPHAPALVRGAPARPRGALGPARRPRPPRPGAAPPLLRDAARGGDPVAGQRRGQGARGR